MRVFGRLIVLGLVGLALLAGGRWLWRNLHWSDLAAVLGSRIEAALPSSAYEAVGGRWLEFPLSVDAGALRVRTNATVDVDAPAGPDLVWWYAFEFEVLDRDGELLRRGTYYHRSRISRFLEPRSGRAVTRSFLLDPALVPMDGRSMRLFLDAPERAVRLRLRPANRDPAIRNILFRVYEQLSHPPRQLSHRWQRLGEAQRARLARASVYGPDLLREEEKQNLLKRQWQAIGPQGVLGEDYRLERIYFPRDSVGEAVDDDALPQGLFADKLSHAVVPLPEGQWRVKLRFDSASNGPAPSREAAVIVRWYGRGAGQRWEERLPAAAGERHLGVVLDGGLLELIPDAPLVVRAWVGGEGAEFEVTPQPLRLRTFRAEPSDLLTFEIDHAGADPTPFRIDMRALLAPGDVLASGRASYQLLADTGREIARGELAAELPFSTYDRPVDAETGFRVSEPVRFYFHLPPDVAAIRITGPALLFNAYSRPSDLARVVRVPEDYQAFPADDLKQPGWFQLLPRDATRLRASLRSESLEIQPRPPEDDPRVLAGQYDWELYQPEGDWRGRYLLVPRSDGLPIRDQSRAAVFRELAPGKEVIHRFVALPARRDIEPSLVYTRGDAVPMQVTIEVDGHSYFSTRVTGLHGELRLPSLKPGQHRLRLQASQPARWFLNHVDGEGQAFLRRMGMRLDGEGLDFVYRKRSADAEVLTGEFYSAIDSRVQLRVDLDWPGPKPGGPLVDWTFTERIFDIRSAPGRQIPVLSTRGETVHGSERFVLPFGAAMPPGDYRIRVSADGDVAGYLSLYRLIPGQPVTRAFLRE